MSLLHRTVRVDVTNNCVTIEADQKHVAILLRDLSLETAKAVCTPRVRKNATEAAACEASAELQGPATTLTRSGVMRCAYIAQDRVDLSEAVKSLAMCMSRPRAAHLTDLRRLARYIKGNPRCVLVYERQTVDRSPLQVHVDSGWAGDLVGRRSTTGLIIRRGAHLLKHTSTSRLRSDSAARRAIYAR